MEYCDNGVHGFLFVIQGGQRLTLETKKTVDIILRFFGSDMLDSVLFVITSKRGPREKDAQRERFADDSGLPATSCS